MTLDIQRGQTGKIRLTFKLDFPRHLYRAAFVILAMFHFCGEEYDPHTTGGEVISVKIIDITIEKPWKTEVWGQGTSTRS